MRSLVWLLLLAGLVSGTQVLAQQIENSGDEDAVESEAEFPAALEEDGNSEGLEESSAFSSGLSTEAPYDSSTPINSGPVFVKPEGPKAGGVLKVPHPSAADGLLRIEKDGAYLYKTPIRPKSQAMSFRFASMTPPKVAAANGVSFQNLYGTNPQTGLLVDYEWQPFQAFGAIGLQLGLGLIQSSANGRFSDLGVAKEVYQLTTVPLSAFLVYRLEFMRGQWFVPYVSGGGTAYLLYEKRDDDKPAGMAYSPAVGGGGGVHISISRWDPKGSFTLSNEYGISDLWLTAEARVMQGLRADLDYTNQSLSLGLTVDY